MLYTSMLTDTHTHTCIFFSSQSVSYALHIDSYTYIHFVLIVVCLRWRIHQFILTHIHFFLIPPCLLCCIYRCLPPPHMHTNYLISRYSLNPSLSRCVSFALAFIYTIQFFFILRVVFCGSKVPFSSSYIT